MDRDGILLRFDSGHPFWPRDLLLSEGASGSGIDSLVSDGVLAGDDDAMFLTPEGASSFRRLAAECFLEAEPGHPSGEAGSHVFRVRLETAFRRSFVQQGGTREFRPGERMRYVPAPPDDAVVRLAGGRPVWLAGKNEWVRAFRLRFPNTGMGARTGFPSPDDVRSWLAETGVRAGELDVDLLMLCGYDIQHYIHFPPHPNDTAGLLNRDRYFCFRTPGSASVEALLATTGRMHRVMEYLRRAVIPGYVDRDSQDQDQINWLVFASEAERETERIAALLSPFGEDLTAPAFPFEVWGISVESLLSVRTPFDNVHELFASQARPIRRIA
jgi:hypothetical protein